MLRPALPCSLACVALLLAVGCKDEVPPTWPAEASLEASEVGTTSAKLTWPAAQDEQGVVSYRLMMSTPDKDTTDQIAHLSSDARYHSATGLAEAASMSFTILALDEAGNRSEGLSVEVETTDGTPPAWPEGAKVTSGPLVEVDTEEEAEPDEFAIPERRLRLSWPAATDNVGVTNYLIQRDSGVSKKLGPEETETLFQTDHPKSTFSLLAGDAAGNWSEPLPIDVSLLDKDSQAAYAARREAIQNKIAGRGLLKILGKRGPGNTESLLADAFSDGSMAGDLDPFEGVGGVMVASGAGTRGGSGSVASIADLGQEREKERVEGRVAVGIVKTDDVGLEKGLKKALRQRTGRFKACYEKRLKASPDLRGKIVLLLSFTKGRVQSASIETDTIGDAGLQACIKRSAKTLRLPGASSEATATLIFARAK